MMVMVLGILIGCCRSDYENTAQDQLTDDMTQLPMDIPILESDFLEEWDIDGDGRADEIYFDYSGGAHCCYTITIIMSTDSIERSYPFEMDGGYETGQPDGSQPQSFNIKDYDKDGMDEVFMEIQTYNGYLNPIPKEWEKEYGVTSNYIIFDFDGSLNIISLPRFIAVEQFFLHQERDQLPLKMIPFKKGDQHNGYKYGFKDESGAIVILPILDAVNEFSSGVAIVKFEGNETMINKRGEIICTFSDYTLIDDKIDEDGLLLFFNHQINGFYYMNSKGDTINTKPYVDAKSFTEGLAAVKDDSKKWGYVDKKNVWVIQPIYHYADPFENGKAFVKLKNGYIWINRNGEEIN